MSTKFYFQSLKVHNFRSFHELSIDRLKRINIIGGFNGVGKTALLETAFFILDRRNAVALIKPLLFRRFESSASIDPIQFFYDSKVDRACIEWTTEAGPSHMDIVHEAKPDDISLTFDVGASGANFVGQYGTDTLVASNKGLHIQTYSGKSKVPDERFFCTAAPSGLTGIVQKSSSSYIPFAEYLSTATRGSSKQLAQHISMLVKQRRLNEVVKYMRTLHPTLDTLTTLQDGEEVQVFAEFEDRMLPVQYMGDGFQNLLFALCAIVRCANGVVFFDEIDSAIHYSRVADIWKIIASAAEKENCQIFATTHSRECINSAARGVAEAGRSKDFQYLRLEVKDKTHSVISYTMDEVSNAEQYDIEIR